MSSNSDNLILVRIIDGPYEGHLSYVDKNQNSLVYRESLKRYVYEFPGQHIERPNKLIYYYLHKYNYTKLNGFQESFAIASLSLEETVEIQSAAHQTAKELLHAENHLRPL